VKIYQSFTLQLNRAVKLVEGEGTIGLFRRSFEDDFMKRDPAAVRQS
jgi:hypothetical protein